MNTAAEQPITMMPTSSTHAFAASADTTAPATASPAPASIARFSPMRATTGPAGRLPSVWPIMIAPAMNPANSIPAPIEAATVGMTGMIAPSPIAKTRAGRRATTTTCERLVLRRRAASVTGTA